MIRVFSFLTAMLFMMIVFPSLVEAQSTPTAEDSRFGLNHIWYNPSAPGGAYCTINNYPTYAAIGVKWVRPHPGRAIWGLREPTDGTYVWGALDAEVLEAQNNGMRMLMTIFPYAEWDYANCGLYGTNPNLDPTFFQDLGPKRYLYCDVGDMSDWLTDLMARYNTGSGSTVTGLGNTVQYFEISNEPSIQGALGGTEFFWEGDYEDYAQLLDETHTAIMGYDSSNKVLNGGMLRHDPADSTYNGVDQYWSDVFRTIDSSTTIDYFSYHAVEASGAYIDANVADLSSHLVSDYGLSSTPIWVTELEFDETEVLANSTLYTRFGGSLSYDEAAEHMTETYVETFAAGAEKIFLAGHYDDSIADSSVTCVGYSPSANNDVFALLDSNTNHTANWHAFKTLIAQLDYFDSVTTISASKAWKFEFPHKNDVYVIGIGEKPSDHITAYSAGDTIEIIDMMGSSQSVVLPSSGVGGPFHTPVPRITYITD